MVEPHSGQTQESSCQRWPALNQVTCGGRSRAGWRGGCPHHHRVVGVGHHPYVRVPDQGGAPELRHHGDLLGPVELVAGEVEQRDHVRLGRLQHLGEVVLVDLQHRVRGAAGLGQRRGVAGGHVGAEGVGGDPAEHADRGGGRAGWWWSCRWCRRPARWRARPTRWASRSGSIFRPIQPPITEPSPRPAARDSAAAVRDTELATFARRGIFASVTRARLPDRPLHHGDRRRRRTVRPGTAAVGRPARCHVHRLGVGRCRIMSETRRGGDAPRPSTPPHPR